MWNLYQLAKTWQVRPSQLLAIEDAFEAFCFDQAVAEVGDTIMAELNRIEAKSQAEHDAKAARVIRKYLGGTAAAAKQQYRSITAPTK